MGHGPYYLIVDTYIFMSMQCANGHIACHSCRMKMQDKCPSCGMQISSNRCRAMEKLMDSVIVYYKKHDHEQECPNMGCFCPYPLCNFADPYKNLYIHFSEHKSAATSFTYKTPFSVSFEKNQKYVFLQKRNEGFLFVLKHHVRKYGRHFSVECIGSSLLDNQFVYQLTAKCMDTSFSLESVPEVHTRFDHQTRSKNSLTIPLSSLYKSGRVSVRLRVKKAPNV
ncbi:E3 ubiquitin-protein ligase SINA-like 7 [Rutidosis leptorrhynchoides]|uniref:E3 ubiquitin-protein ligase SINA-like 7 n=1 Tax=Rutidosis leptorrhynchoides TaxID=125765 RepID=UPI003A9A086F